MKTDTTGFLAGQIQLSQPIDGYRAGIDAVLLASAMDISAGKKAVEFGCGPGTAIFCAAILNPEARFLGLEKDDAIATLANENLQFNDSQSRVEIQNCDALDWKSDKAVDAIFFNPPFFDDPSSLRAPKPEKTAAWMNETSLDDWIRTALKRLIEGGVLTLIHRADRLADILAALEAKAGDIQILPIQPRATQPAKRVIISARKVSKAPLCIRPAIVLHPEKGSSYTPEADALLKGHEKLALLSV